MRYLTNASSFVPLANALIEQNPGDRFKITTVWGAEIVAYPPITVGPDAYQFNVSMDRTAERRIIRVEAIASITAERP